MFSLVEQWQHSGESQRYWCDLHGLHLAKFQYWVRKFRATHATATDSSFIELLPSPQSVAMIELHFPVASQNVCTARSVSPVRRG
jgi:hypothetical protein